MNQSALIVYVCRLLNWLYFLLVEPKATGAVTWLPVLSSDIQVCFIGKAVVSLFPATVRCWI